MLYWQAYKTQHTGTNTKISLLYINFPIKPTTSKLPSTWAESARADFNLWERFCYLLNTYEIFVTFTKIYWRTCHGNPIFDDMHA